jgi:hypothetical protein
MLFLCLLPACTARAGMHLANSWTEQVERRSPEFRWSENLISAVPVRPATLRHVNTHSFSCFMKRCTRLAPYCLGYVPANVLGLRASAASRGNAREHCTKFTCCLQFGFDFGLRFLTYIIVPPRH